MNKAILMGRLTRDPELRYTSSNRAVCQFTVAIDRPFTNQASGQREADFINVVAWDRTGENVGKNEKSIAYSLTFMDSKRTLNEEEVLEIMQKIIDAVQNKCNAKLR